MSKFMDLVKQVVSKGIEVTLQMRNNEMVADLNFQAKSSGYLVDRDGVLYLITSYFADVEISSIEDIMCAFAFIEAYFMRDFGSDQWLGICKEAGLIKKNTVTTTKVTYS